MKFKSSSQRLHPTDAEHMSEDVGYDFGLNRRCFVQLLSTGLMIAVNATPALAQRRGDRGGRGIKLGARIHLAKDGSVTVMTGKVEGGQGARAEVTQAAAEELGLSPSQVQVVMADTDLVPDDGITAGSRSTPSTVPAVRQGAAAARELLIDTACKRWNVERSAVEMKEGKAVHASSQRTFGYADLANSEEAAKSLDEAIPSQVPLTAGDRWKVLGAALGRPNDRGLVTGSHSYPSDVTRPGLLYGKVLRQPSYGAKLVSIDLSPAKAMKDVIPVQDENLVGVVAPTTLLARNALASIAATTKWEPAPHPSSEELYDFLKKKVRDPLPTNPFSDEIAQAKQVLRQTYHVAYAQHAPLEPRAAVAEWTDGKLTVWTGTQNPFGYRSELARAFHVPEDHVRVVVPDFGSGYGGKHTAEAAVEAARLAKAANRPVSLRWTREEEFTWAYFRPAAVIEIEASLDEAGKLTSWHFININSGGSAIDTPYRAGKHQSRFVGSEAPLRQGSYRALAATANTFARESFMDELAAGAGTDPLQFRLAHLDNPRLRAVLETAAERFGWRDLTGKKRPGLGVGLACGTEKGSYVAACVEIAVDSDSKKISVRRVCEVFECGAVLNPENLTNQVQGAVIMGLGPALREEMKFAKGEMLNASFRNYQVPRFADVPELEVHLLNRPDLPSVGGGETPIIAIAPAIANAVYQATGTRIRQMPIRI